MNLITQTHYDDIVSERAIDGKCGYVLCTNPLQSFRPQKYHICTKTNTVLDLSERKKFCCETCFCFSNYLHEQILTSPLWLREEKDKKHYIFKDEENTTLPIEETKNDIHETTNPKIVVKSKKNISRPKSYLKEENNAGLAFDIFKQWWTKEATAFLNGEDFEISKTMASASLQSIPPATATTLLESQNMKKVEAFYQGTTDIDQSDIYSVKEVDCNGRIPVLPQIDKKAQRSMRRNIVLEGFQKT